MEDVSRWQLVGMALLWTLSGVQLLGAGVATWLWVGVVALCSTGGVLAWRWHLRDAWRTTSVGESVSAANSTGQVVLGLFFVGCLWLSFSYTVVFLTFATGLIAGYFVVFAAEWLDLRARLGEGAAA